MGIVGHRATDLPFSLPIAMELYPERHHAFKFSWDYYQ